MTNMIVEAASLYEFVQKIVDDALEPHGHFLCNLYEGQNSQGEESLFVEVCYSGNARNVPAADSLKLRTKLRDELFAQGEKRFPYLSYLFEDET